MQDPKRYTITAALPYANGPIHIGHLAGCYLPADIYVRYLRLKGKDVQFMCGSDEHGVAITMKAKKEGITPQEVVDRYHTMMKDALNDFGISFDHYSRTSSEVHKETASEFFKNLYEKGVFETRETEQYFDEEANQFLADRYIMGTCPVCGHEDAYGDQCENCGSSLNPTDLKNPRSTLSGASPVLRKTTNWFLPLDKLAPKIREFIEKHSDWKPNVYGQCKSWLDAGDGLQPRSMTRDLDWGVPVPVEGAEGKVLYVWFDAPIGYISATKEHLGDDWEKWWKSEDTRLIHFIGKDNIVFHCIIFPAILMEHGEFILPDNVPANEFLNLEGKKISTSRNWAVWLHEYLVDFENKQDILRYTLAASMPETKDNDFTWGEFQTRNNSELVAVFGNFVNRVMVLNQKYYNGVVPSPAVLTDADKSALTEVKTSLEKLEASIENFKFREALSALMNIARTGNKYLADEEPWKTQKTDPVRTASVMHWATQITSILAVACEPFLPFTSQKMRGFLNLGDDVNWAAINRGVELLKEGHQLGKSELLFEKIEDEEVQKQLNKLEESAKSQEVETVNLEPAKDEATFDDFMKMDIRTATILEAEKVKKADKLLKLKVDTGLDVRTVVSGIAEHFSPDEVVGKQVCLLANLAPRKIRGVESQGMILMAENAEGKLVFVRPEQAIENGMVIA
ncbi:methionine--tRNA ligase [Phaeocystidibacter luteus]|uniref:Methionine--tRNA ligase n=1 Tax=Phaeocystidibacter luteus TaxID=911197 RepID=A0A6N6RH84_9FLAO|nr:methionine--tRNA ligase [Phaeocystidibacter luteus]KAB2813645.1 methionine--tRNA ligase [Phaeocystidibacter luteus]